MMSIYNVLTMLASALPALFRIFNIGSARYGTISSARLRKSVITTLERITYRAYRFMGRSGYFFVLARFVISKSGGRWTPIIAPPRLNRSKKEPRSGLRFREREKEESLFP